MQSALAVPSLWAILEIEELAIAREALRSREETSLDNIGVWLPDDDSPNMIHDLPNWAIPRGIEAVIWTALPPNFNGSDDPTLSQIVTYLCGLNGVTRDNAERYVRFTPRQIDTRYRRAIEAALHWTPLSTPG